MLSDIFKAGASSVAADLRRHLSPVALDALIESLRAEEPSGALATSTLYLLEELDPEVDQNHQAQCLEFGYELVA
jgi:hypothetical protein